MARKSAVPRQPSATQPPIVVAAPPVVAKPAAPRKRAAPKPKAERQPVAAPPVAEDDGRARTMEARRALPGFARDNPEALAGDALRELAHERGMARSELATMNDDKVREQLRYLVSASYSEA